MTPRNDSRSRYLNVALKARKVIDLLLPFADTGEPSVLSAPQIKEAAHAFRGRGEVADLLGSLRARQPLPTFEEVTVLDEALGTTGQDTLAQMLDRIADAQLTRENRQTEARKALMLFFSIETSALQRSNQQAPFIPLTSSAV